jgi:hypothetical protein
VTVNIFFDEGMGVGVVDDYDRSYFTHADRRPQSSLGWHE